MLHKSQITTAKTEHQAGNRMASIEIRRGCLMLCVPESIVTEALHNLGTEIEKLVPAKCIECKTERDGDAEKSFHITILNSIERKSDSTVKSKCEEDFDLNTNFTIIGLGSVNQEVFYLICHYVSGDILRKKLKLPEQDFHITIGFHGKDVHDVRKNIGTMTHQVESDWIKCFLDSIRDSKLVLKKYIEILDFIVSLDREVNNVDALFSLAKLLGVNGDHSSSLAIAKRLSSLDIVKSAFIEIKISKYLGLPVDEILRNLKSYLIGSSPSPSPELKTVLEELNSFEGIRKYAIVFDSHTNTVVETKIPHNFTMIDDRVGGSGMITNQNIGSVIDHFNFKDVITLTEDPIVIDECYLSQINFHFFPIRDRFPPDDPEVMSTILNILMSSPKALVHCLGGVGRTNTVLACYLIKVKNMSPSEAMSFIDSNRKMILSGEQVNFIKSFYSSLFNPKYNGISRDKMRELPKWIMLVGCPASGKSTLSAKFIQKYGNQIVHINQDELGKKECVRFFIENLKSDKTIILDRCNGTKLQRKEWLEYFKHGTHHAQRPVCIYLHFPLPVCEERLLERKDHLTLSGPGGVRILRIHYRAIEPPTEREGFSNVFKVDDDETYFQLLESYGLPHSEETLAELNELDDNQENKFVKFPRTKHAINLGSASRDDLIMTEGDLQMLIDGPIVVEEKIDGANLGISIDSSGKILVQNRSHYVNPSTHPQFKLLGVWIENHREELAEILEWTNQILFGEWVYAKHSIQYTKLPDYFLVYDLYTISTNSFASRGVLDNLLQHTSLQQVPKIGEGKYSKDELVNLVSNTISRFSDEIVEGIYIRKGSEDFKLTQARGKVVRVGFIAGNQHWTKYKIQKNLLREEY